MAARASVVDDNHGLLWPRRLMHGLLDRLLDDGLLDRGLLRD